MISAHNKFFQSSYRLKVQNLLSDIFKYSLNVPTVINLTIFKRNVHMKSVKFRNITSSVINISFLEKSPSFKSQLRFLDTRATSEESIDPFTSYSSLSIRQTLDICEKQLKKENVDEAILSSEYIISRALGVKRVELVKYLDEMVSGESLENIKRMMKCRLSRMPIQYILGDWDFHSVTLKLRPPVFIPRPETEELVNMAVSIIKNINKVNNPIILEIGCGSGAVSLALLFLLPTLTSVAIDQSKYAVDLTTENAKNLHLHDRLHVIHGKVTEETFPSLPYEKFDLIISNPPYIPQNDIINLPPEIKLYEDIRAVYGGVEGLDVIKGIILHGQHLLKDDARILMEIDSSHFHTLPSWMEKNKSSMEIENFSKCFINKVTRYVQLKKK